MRVRVLTINVQHDHGDCARRTAALNQQLRQLAPDLVTLQEVCYPARRDDPDRRDDPAPRDDPARRSDPARHDDPDRRGDPARRSDPDRYSSPVRHDYPDRHDQLAALVAGTGLHATHQAELLDYLPPGADRYGGTAVATRRPHRVVAVVDQRLPGSYWWTLAVSVPVPDLGELLLITPTTRWELDDEIARERQAVQVADLDARHRADLPTVIAGDFNAAPEAASIRFLSGLQSLAGRSAHYHDAWTVAGSGPGHTWSVDNPAGAAEIDRLVGQPDHRRRVDYVFVGSAHAHPRARARIVAARLVGDQPVDGVWLSDHASVLVDLDLTRTA